MIDHPTVIKFLIRLTGINEIWEDPRGINLACSLSNEEALRLIESIVSGREYFIVAGRLGFLNLPFKNTLKNLGGVLNISDTRVMQIENRAYRKLRHPKNPEKLVKLRNKIYKLYKTIQIEEKTKFELELQNRAKEYQNSKGVEA